MSNRSKPATHRALCGHRNQAVARVDYGADDRVAQHYRTRAAGQLVMGPLNAVGYDNRVIRLTADELEFRTSAEAYRFMDHQRRKYARPELRSRSRRLCHISQYDEED